MKNIISFKLALILLCTSLSTLAPVAQAIAKDDKCENGECIQKKIDKLENLGKLYKNQCLPKNIKHADIPKHQEKNGVSEECWKILTEVNHLEEQLAKEQTRLESKLGCESGDCKLPNAGVSLNSQIKDLSKIEENSCTATKKQEIKNSCSSDLGCVVTASALGVGGYLAEVLVPDNMKPKNCHLGDDSCVTQLATSFIKAAVTFFQGAWWIVSSAGKFAGKKMGEFWNWVSGAEDHSSTSQLAMAKASEDPGIFAEMKDDFPGTMKKIFAAFVASLKEWMKTDVLCQKWAGVPRASKCLTPTNSFDCIPCKTMVTGLCSISGTLIAEVVPAFLSGGLTIAIKQGVNGAAKIATLFKASQKGITAVKNTKLGQAAVAASTKTDEVLRVSKSVHAAKDAVTAALKAIQTYMLSPSRKALKTSYTSMTAALSKGGVYIAETPVGKVLGFAGTTLKYTFKTVLYPVDNPLTQASYRSGARSFDKVFKLGQPKLASQTVVSASLIQKNPELEKVLAKIEEAKISTKTDEAKLLALEEDLLTKIEPIRQDAAKIALSKNGVEFSDVIKDLYPELQYGALAKKLPTEKIAAAEKQLYLEISHLPDGANKTKLMSSYKNYVSNNQMRTAVAKDLKSPFDPDVRAVHKTAAQENFNKPLNATDAVTKADIREYMGASYDEMLANAAKTERIIQTSSKPVVYDAVAVGAGPNTSVAVAALKETNPGLNVLVIERTDDLGTFHRVKGFDINSAEFIGDSGNTFPSSPVQLRDFNINNASYATAEELGHVTQGALKSADVDLIINNNIVKWAKEPSPGAWPAKYKIETDKGNIIYTNAGMVTQGLGTPVTRLKDPSSVKIVSKYQDEAKAIDLTKDPKYVPRAQNVEEFIENAVKDQKLGRQAVARYQGKKILLVGDGDGGSIGAETAAGLNKQLNPQNLKTDVEVVWMGQPAKTGEEFVASLSKPKVPRYSRIGEAIDDGRIKPVHGYLQRVEEFVDEAGDKKFKAFYTTKKGEPITEPVIVDNIVFATGYTHSHATAAPIFASMAKNGNAAADEVVFKPLMGRANEYTRYEKLKTKSDYEINKQLVVNDAKEDIYLMGMASKTPISKRKMREATGGFLDITGPRAAATGKIVAQNLAPQNLTKAQMHTLLTPVKGQTLQVIKRPVRNSAEGNIILKNGNVADIHTKIEIGRVLKNLKSTPNTSFYVNIVPDAKGQYVFRVNGLDQKSSEEVIKALMGNEKLTHGFNEQFRLGRNQLNIEVPTRESGQMKIEDLRFRADTVVLEEAIEPPMNFTRGFFKLMSPTLRAGDHQSEQEEKKH